MLEAIAKNNNSYNKNKINIKMENLGVCIIFECGVIIIHINYLCTYIDSLKLFFLNNLHKRIVSIILFILIPYTLHYICAQKRFIYPEKYCVHLTHF